MKLFDGAIVGLKLGFVVGAFVGFNVGLVVGLDVLIGSDGDVVGLSVRPSVEASEEGRKLELSGIDEGVEAGAALASSIPDGAMLASE